MTEEKKQYQNHEQDRRLDAVEQHITTTNEEMGDIKICISSIKTDVVWLKWWMKLVAGSAISSLIIGIISLILNK